MGKPTSVLAAVVILSFCLTVSVAAGEEDEMIVMAHLGGSLAVNLDAVETVFYLEKDGRQRFHLVWRGNAEGTTIEGAQATETWNRIQGEWKDDFLWVTHMGGSIGIARDAVSSVFFMAPKDGKRAMLRINYGSDSKAIEGAEAESLWASLSK